MWNEAFFCELSAQIIEKNSIDNQWWIIDAIKFFESEKGKECSVSKRKILKMNISELMRREKYIFKQLSLSINEDDVRDGLKYTLSKEKKEKILSIINDVSFLYKLRNSHLPDCNERLNILTDMTKDNSDYALYIYFNRRNDRTLYIENINIEKIKDKESE